jgi:hypothetical protein
VHCRERQLCPGVMSDDLQIYVQNVVIRSSHAICRRTTFHESLIWGFSAICAGGIIRCDGLAVAPCLAPTPLSLRGSRPFHIATGCPPPRSAEQSRAISPKPLDYDARCSAVKANASFLSRVRLVCWLTSNLDTRTLIVRRIRLSRWWRHLNAANHSNQPQSAALDGKRCHTQ